MKAKNRVCTELYWIKFLKNENFCLKFEKKNNEIEMKRKQKTLLQMDSVNGEVNEKIILYEFKWNESENMLTQRLWVLCF